MAAQHLLGGRDRGAHPHAQRGVPVRQQVERLHERRARLLALPQRTQRLRQRHQRPHARLAVPGEDPQGRAVPAGGRGGRSPGGGVGRVEQHGGCPRVAGRRGLLHVVGAPGRRHAVGGQRGRGACVRRDPPAALRRVVDRPAHERVPEREPARDGGGRHEVRVEERVEQLEGALRRELGDPRRQCGLEGVSRHGGALEQLPGPRSERRDLRGERGRHRGRDAVEASAARRRRGGGERAQVERVAAALAYERRVGPAAQQLRGLGGCERA